MNESCRVCLAYPPRRPWMSFGKSVSIRQVLLLLFAYLGPLVSSSAVGAATYGSSTYVFHPDQSIVLQTGGIAGVQRVYWLEGQFQLSIDPNSGTAAFSAVDARAMSDASSVPPLDLDDTFNLTGLTGLPSCGGPCSYLFEGQTADGSAVEITLVADDGFFRLRGQTTPPPGSADFFTFSIDAVAQRKYGGGAGTADDPYQIWTPRQMNAIGANPDDWDRHFRLMADVDLGGYKGEQFNVIGRDFPQVPPFSGSFDGNGFRILNFTYQTWRAESVGLFGYVSTPLAFGGPPAVKNLGLVDPTVEAPNASGVAALVGQIFNGTISGCYVEGGRVSGHSGVGGLVGYTSETNMATERMIVDCRASCQVSGADSVGGLAGGVSPMVGVLRCRSSGTVIGGQDVGGLIGASGFAQISDCYSSSRVIGESDTGGLVGRSQGDTITACGAWGRVDGLGTTGGLVGDCMGTITDCYSLAPVSGASYVGGLVGVNRGTVSKCYAAGPVSGKSDVGGLIGALVTEPFAPPSAVTDSLWDVEASGQATSGGGVGKTTPEMQTAATFLEAGWDFVGETANGTEDVWWIDEGRDYPRLWRGPPMRNCGTGEPNDPYQIWTAEQMNAIGANPEDWDKHFKLMADIDFRQHQGDEVRPIREFNGVFDGDDHTISNLTYQVHATDSPAFHGLFQFVSGMIKNLRLADPDVTASGGNDVGALVGRLQGGTLVNCHVDGGKVSGSTCVGGLVGDSILGMVAECHANTTVIGYSVVGGLAGSNGVGNRGTIMRCYAKGTAEGENIVGGLVGMNDGTIRDCYASASVTGTAIVGGWTKPLRGRRRHRQPCSVAYGCPHSSAPEVLGYAPCQTPRGWVS